jgi:hypothetical protein
VTASAVASKAAGEPTDRKLFAALLRRIDAIDQSYRT